MGIVGLERMSILYVVDSQTKFSAITFLIDSSTSSVWVMFVECWRSFYTGLPNRIRVYRGSCFGETLLTFARGAYVDIGRSGIEAYSSLGIGENFH